MDKKRKGRSEERRRSVRVLLRIPVRVLGESQAVGRRVARRAGADGRQARSLGHQISSRVRQFWHGTGAGRARIAPG